VGEGGGKRVSLNVEVPEHFVRAPATKEANFVGVDLGTEEGHGTTQSEGSGRDVFRGKA
jgi:hypothetical protein